MSATQQALASYGAAAGAPFVPTDISGLALWLKADAGTFTTSAMTTPAVADADPVGGWQDQSGNGKHVVQATSTKRGTLKTGANGQNGRAVIRGDGVDDLLVSATVASVATDNITVFVACRESVIDAVNINYPIFNGDGLNNGYGLKHIDSTNGRKLKAPPFADMVITGTLDTAFSVMMFKRASGVMSVRLNGSAGSISNSTTAVVTPTVGTSVLGRTDGIGSGDVDLAEVLLYDAALSAGDITSVETYLNARWAAF